MTSKAQRKQGYPLPTNEWEDETVSFCVTIPAGEAYRMAFLAQLYKLGKYWMWKRDEERNHAASDTATNWRDKLTVQENCEGEAMSCEDIENCLETSEIITNLNNQIIELNEIINELEQQIEEQDDDGNGNTGVENPSPNAPAITGDAYSSAMCQSAYFIADELIDMFTHAWGDLETMTLQEWVEALLSLGGFDMDGVLQFWLWWQSVTNPTLPDDVLAARESIAEWVFCGELDKDQISENIYADSEADSAVKDAVYYMLFTLTDEKLKQLAYIGSLGTGANDCSEFCEWVVVWDFTNGSYEPEDENETVYLGQAWNGEGCVFIEGVGWSGIADVWSIEHGLPRDCRIISMQTNVNKNEPCLAVDVSTSWRGTTGEDAEALGFEQRVLSNAAVTLDWNLYHAEMGSMTVQHDHFLCDPSDAYGSQIHWVKMTGTGAKPSR